MGWAFLDHPLPLAIAHRGGALEAEENTLPAFAAAAALGYVYAETDVQATADGVAVVFHDDTTDRMLGRPGRIDALSWEALSRLRTKGGNPVPRLAELLEAQPGMRFILEAKADAAVPGMVQAIRDAGALERVCVGSFAPGRTAALRAALGPGLAWSPAHAGVARVWLRGWGLPLPLPGCAALHVPTRFRGVPVVTPRMLAAAHRAGIQVHVWTVDDPAEMARLLDMGVDGLMTDRPAVLKRLLQERGAWAGA